MITQHHMTQLGNRLFKAEEARLFGEMVDIHKANCAALNKQNLTGFAVKQKVFRVTTGIGIRPQYELSPQLLKRAEIFAEDSEKFENDKKRITQILSLVPNAVRELQDVRDLLPDCMVQLLWKDNFSRIPDRTREVAYSFKTNTVRYSQFMKLVPLMQYYCMTHILT